MACAIVGLLAPHLAAAPQPPAAHPGEYAPADIAYGARLYDAQCTTCHGVEWRRRRRRESASGRFRNAVSDQDLARVVTAGIPAPECWRSSSIPPN